MPSVCVAVGAMIVALRTLLAEWPVRGSMMW